MELDDQLAALAAGELDDDTARALRARAAADPALGRRLARHQRLQTLLTTWQAPPLAPEASTRIDTAIDAALADLDDGPLADATRPGASLAAVPAPPGTDRTPADTGAAPGDVVELGAARERRDRGRALPPWLSATAVAAALLAVVGVGVIVGGGGFGQDDSDVIADSATDESAEAGMAESDMAEESADQEASALAPAARGDLDIGEGDLLLLLDDATQLDAPAQDGADAMGDDADDGDDAAADAGVVEAPDACTVEALERDTVGDDAEVIQFAAGTYAGAPAQFVVVRSPTDDAGDRYDVLAYDPLDCSLLDRATDVR